MHEILITTYSNNWRWYLHEIAETFQLDVGEPQSEPWMVHQVQCNRKAKINLLNSQTRSSQPTSARKARKSRKR
jgi:hypothetical protein